MRVYCRCGNMLTNQLDPNDTEYYVLFRQRMV